MSRTFSTEFDINAPAERVWAVMSDVDRWHEWTPSVTRIKRLGGAPLSVGTRALVRQPRFPPALWKVTAMDPGRSFTWVSVAPGLHVVAHHSVQPTPEGSRATLSIAYSGVVGKLLAWLTTSITERYLAMEAAGLKARSENPNYFH